MADDKSISKFHYTINIPEFDAFKKVCDTNPMCDGWTAEDDAGWMTVTVPNWSARVRDFYQMINES